jgi:hypothetical protein
MVAMNGVKLFSRVRERNKKMGARVPSLAKRNAYGVTRRRGGFARHFATAGTPGCPLPPREVFAKLNAGLPAAQRYKRLGNVDGPVAADICRAPLATSLT